MLSLEAAVPETGSVGGRNAVKTLNIQQEFGNGLSPLEAIYSTFTFL